MSWSTESKNCWKDSGEVNTMSVLVAWFVRPILLILLLQYRDLIYCFICVVYPHEEVFVLLVVCFSLQCTQRTPKGKMESPPCMAAGSYQRGWSFWVFLLWLLPVYSAVSCCLMLSGSFHHGLLNCEVEIWCPYITEHLYYLIKQGATWINRAAQTENQENTFQLVTAGPVTEGPNCREK